MGWRYQYMPLDTGVNRTTDRQLQYRIGEVQGIGAFTHICDIMRYVTMR